MKSLWTRLSDVCYDIVVYAMTIIIVISILLVPVTIFAWCIRFWMLLF